MDEASDTPDEDWWQGYARDVCGLWEEYATASGPREEARVLAELDTAMANLASMCGWRPAVTPLVADLYRHRQ